MIELTEKEALLLVNIMAENSRLLYEGGNVEELDKQLTDKLITHYWLSEDEFENAELSKCEAKDKELVDDTKGLFEKLCARLGIEL